MSNTTSISPVHESKSANASTVKNKAKPYDNNNKKKLEADEALVLAYSMTLKATRQVSNFQGERQAYFSAYVKFIEY